MKALSISALVFSSALYLGCSQTTQDNASETARDAGQTAESAGDDAARAAREAADKTGNAADRTGNAIERAGDATADAAKEAGSAVKDALENAGRAGDAAVETFDVKAALTADSRVNASDINVDTDHVTKTVVLKGHVPTAAQKTTAGEIATKQAKGYNVRNELTIG